MDLVLSPRRVARSLVGLAVAVALLGAAGELARLFPDSDAPPVRVLRGLRWAFRPSGEQNVSTWVAAGLLLLCGLALLAIAAGTARGGGRYVGHWRALGAIFLFLSCDEAMLIHEQVGDRVRRVVPTDGFLLWAWVVPYALLTALVALAYLPFLRHLPPPTRRAVLLAGAAYVAGALALESVQARIVDAAGHGTLAVALLAIVEEFLELLGAALFLAALVAYGGERGLSLRIGPGEAAAPPGPSEPRSLVAPEAKPRARADGPAVRKAG